jgi:hypothetical protein
MASPYVATSEEFTLLSASPPGADYGALGHLEADHPVCPSSGGAPEKTVIRDGDNGVRKHQEVTRETLKYVFPAFAIGVSHTNAIWKDYDSLDYGRILLNQASFDTLGFRTA